MRYVRFFFQVWVCAAGFALGAGLLNLGCRPAGGADVIVYAPTSIQDALRAITADYRRESGKSIQLTFAPAAELIRKLDDGEKADLLITDSPDMLDQADRDGLLVLGSRHSLPITRLVVIGPSAALPPLEQVEDLDTLDRIALPDPRTTGAGQIVQDFLQKEGLWELLEPKLLLAPTTRDAVSRVAHQEAMAGIVLMPDAMSTRDVRLIFEIDPDAHAPARFMASIVKGAPNPSDARDYMQTLLGEDAASRFRLYGFFPQD